MITRPLAVLQKLTCILAISTCCYCGVVNAEEYRFYVTDRAGTPLENVAIMLPGKAVEPPQDLAVMDQIDISFAPQLLVIQQGQRVSFPNSDNIRHHVYSFSPTKTFEIRLYAGTPEAPVIFEDPGIVVLGCNIHDSMIGYIVVADSPYAGKTDERGLLTLHTEQPVENLRIWHPLMSVIDVEAMKMAMPAENTQQQRVLVVDVELPPTTKTTNTFKSRYKR